MDVIVRLGAKTPHRQQPFQPGKLADTCNYMGHSTDAVGNFYLPKVRVPKYGEKPMIQPYVETKSQRDQVTVVVRLLAGDQGEHSVSATH